MKIELEGGICKLTPVTVEERRALSAWVAKLDRGAKLHYRGRGPNDGNEDFWTIILESAGIGLRLRGEIEPEKLIVNDLRNVCFFGRVGGLLLVDWAFQGEALEYVLLSGGHCERCQASVIDPGSAQWGVCLACAKQCEHHLTETEKLTANYSTGKLGAARFCTGCGRVPETMKD